MKHILILSFVLTAFVSFGQKQPGLPANVVESIEKRIANGNNPSIAVGIIDKNGAQYYNFGLTKKDGANVNEHTIYEIGSISKVFTGILLAKNVNEGRMKLDDPIKKYLPASVKIPTRGEKEITLGNLSDHTSALPRMPGNFFPANQLNPYADYTVEQMYNFISGYQLPRDIGSAYEYSNLAQGLLGHILALNASVPYETLMIKTIATPLGMKETKITFDETMKKNLATPHSNGVEVQNWDIPTFAGAGAIRSSSSDMLKFLSANLGLTKSPLKKHMDKSHEVRHDKVGNGMRVGLGWHVAKGKNGDVIWHNGGTGGYRAFAGFVKETGVGVVLLTNSTESVDDIGFHLLNPDATLRNVKTKFTGQMQKTIDSKGIEAAIAEFRELKKTKPDEYDFSEDAINEFGYTFMQKDVKIAMEIFKLNVELYPNSFNVYDSYGEALAAYAIENYKKSIEMNPGNTNGIEALKKLGVTADVKTPEVSEETLQTYVGTYQLRPGFDIVITRDGKQLFGQATGQPRFELYATNKTEFYLKVVDARITFSTNETGVVESLTLHQNGAHVPGKRVN